MSGDGGLRRLVNSKVELNGEAAVSISKALTITVVSAVLLFGLAIWVGNTFFTQGSSSYYDNRVAELKEAVSQNPENRAAVLELALTMYLKGDIRQGLSLARQVQAKYPDDPGALFNLGLMLSDLGEYKEAIALLEKLSGVSPGYEAGRVNFYLGKSYLETGNYQRALAKLEMALKRDPGSAVGCFYLGQALEKTGNKEGALEAYKRAVLLSGGNYPVARKAVKRLSK